MPQDLEGEPLEENPPEEVSELPPEPECPYGLLDGTLERPLELPALAHTLVSAPAFYLVDQLGRGTQALASEFAVPLALGTVAESAVRLDLDTIEDFACGGTDAVFTVGSIHVLEGNARVTQADAPSIVAVEADEAGYSRVVVHGVARKESSGDCFDGPLEAPFVYTLLIQAGEFAWSVEPREDCPAATTAGRPLPIVVRARDSAGQVVSPVNIEQPALSVSTSEGVWLKPRDESMGLTPNELLAARLAVPDAIPVGAGTVTVALSDGSSAVDVRVLAPEELNDVQLDYWMSGIISRGDIPLDDGESYRFTGEAPMLDVYARWVEYDGAWLCGRPDAGDLLITSMTPDVCKVESRTCQPIDELFMGSPLFDPVAIIADGTCTLQVDAPAFAGGAGVSKQFSVELTIDGIPPD